MDLDLSIPPPPYTQSPDPYIPPAEYTPSAPYEPQGAFSRSVESTPLVHQSSSTGSLSFINKGLNLLLKSNETQGHTNPSYQSTEVLSSSVPAASTPVSSCSVISSGITSLPSLTLEDSLPPNITQTTTPSTITQATAVSTTGTPTTPTHNAVQSSTPKLPPYSEVEILLSPRSMNDHYMNVKQNSLERRYDSDSDEMLEYDIGDDMVIVSRVLASEKLNVNENDSSAKTIAGASQPARDVNSEVGIGEDIHTNGDASVSNDTKRDTIISCGSSVIDKHIETDLIVDENISSASNMGVKRYMDLRDVCVINEKNPPKPVECNQKDPVKRQEYNWESPDSRELTDIEEDSEGESIVVKIEEGIVNRADGKCDELTVSLVDNFDVYSPKNSSETMETYSNGETKELNGDTISETNEAHESKEPKKSPPLVPCVVKSSEKSEALPTSEELVSTEKLLVLGEITSSDTFDESSVPNELTTEGIAEIENNAPSISVVGNNPDEKDCVLINKEDAPVDTVSNCQQIEEDRSALSNTDSTR